MARSSRNVDSSSGRCEATYAGSTVRDPAAIELAVQVVGDDRVVFGSDYPFNSYEDANPLAKEIDVIRRAQISESARRKIFNENMQRYLEVGV